MLENGTVIYNRDLSQMGTVTGFDCRNCACGRTGKVRVVWEDGRTTLLCPKGLSAHQDGFKII